MKSEEMEYGPYGVGREGDLRMQSVYKADERGAGYNEEVVCQLAKLPKNFAIWRGVANGFF